jgi:hypothetical protein
MRDSQDWEGSMRGFVAVAVTFVMAIAIVTWGPWNATHVASNPGPSGTPGSTVLDRTPPPAEGPSETTTGMPR